MEKGGRKESSLKEGSWLASMMSTVSIESNLGAIRATIMLVMPGVEPQPKTARRFAERNSWPFLSCLRVMW